MNSYPRIASFKTPQAFRARLESLGLGIGCDDRIEPAASSPLAQPLEVDGFRLTNRWVIHPMEGWDASADGNPTESVHERWRKFGRSGAKWIWGGEAMAVVPEGRANPNQLIIQAGTEEGLKRLLEDLHATHRREVDLPGDLLAGFQLTHSGRFCRPFRKDRAEPKIAYRHPILDRKFGIAPDHPILTDDELERIAGCFVAAAGIAERCGAAFVDIKHCHGYLGHELLGAHTRPGRYGGDFDNRTRFLREIVSGIRATTRLRIGVRVSAFDVVPFGGAGVPDEYSHCLPYRYGFGVDADDPESFDLTEAHRFLELLQTLGIRMVNLSAGSPYYNPHVKRPALFPPSDGYAPPEDPLVGCARQITAAAELKSRAPGLAVCGTAYSYLQEYLPHVAQWAVRESKIDAAGIGRMVLAYPEFPRDVLRGAVDHKRLCRTFSDCTTAPRNGLPSGCYPLDPLYKSMPQASQLKQLKKLSSTRESGESFRPAP